VRALLERTGFARFNVAASFWDFQNFVLATSMLPKLKGRSVQFDAEIVMSCRIETSGLSDVPAVIVDFRVLVDFQTLRCMVWSCSVLRAQETGFDG
jgi:hypothetical protein